MAAAPSVAAVLSVDAVHAPGGLNAAYYARVVSRFKAEVVDAALLARFEAVTGVAPHPFLARGVFGSHRGLGRVLDAVEAGRPVYLYTGRGPSAGALHLGHLVPFLFTAYLQRALGCPAVIQLTDDEKFMKQPRLGMEAVAANTRSTAADIIACGFDPTNTFIFSDFHHMGALYPAVCRVLRATTLNQLRACFGLEGGTPAGSAFFPAVQMAPSFASTFPGVLPPGATCLIPCGLDQDPYFRLTRAVAGKLGEAKPAVVHGQFLPSLGGKTTKMSASAAAPAHAPVFVTDTPAAVRKKVGRCVSGGRETLEEHARLGGVVEDDVPLEYLRFFHASGEEVEALAKGFAAGTVTAGEVKAAAAATVTRVLVDFQARRAAVTDATVDAFMAVRRLG